MPVAFPERQLKNTLDLDPLQDAFRVLVPRLAAEALDEKDEAEPVLALLAEARPADCSAQRELLSLGEPTKITLEGRIIAESSHSSAPQYTLLKIVA